MSNIGTVSIIYVALPVANNSSITTSLNTPVNGQLSASGSGTLTYAVVTSPVHGTISGLPNTTGQFTFSPTTGFTGSDSFTFHVTNSTGCVSNTATVNITVNAVSAPVVTSFTLGTFCANTTQTGQLAATNGTPPYTFAQASATTPVGGTVTVLSNGQFTFVPTTGFTGTASFQYQATDSNSQVSNIGTVSIIYVALPVASNSSITTNINTPVNGQLNASGSGTLTYAVVTPPAHGTLTGLPNTTGQFTFSPTTGFTGSDSFTFHVTNSTGCVSNTATVSITVNPQGVNPVASSFTLGSFCNNSISPQTGSLLSHVSPVGPSYTFVSTGSTNGSVVVQSNGNFQFTPSPVGFVGNATFNYQATDPTTGLTSNIATVTIIYVQSPVANNETLTTPPGVPLTNQQLPGIGPSPVTFTVTQPASGQGIVTLTNASLGIFNYDPQSFIGTTQFNFTVSTAYTGFNCTAGGVVTINVSSGQTVTFSTCENTTLTGTLLGFGSAPYVYVITVNPHFGELLINSITGDFTYTPNNGFTGTDTFVYSVTASNGVVTLVNVTIDVNQSPSALCQSFKTSICENVRGILDITGGTKPYRVDIIRRPKLGKLYIKTTTFGDVKFVYVPNEEGIDYFGYVAIDANGCKSNKAKVSIKICKGKRD